MNMRKLRQFDHINGFVLFKGAPFPEHLLWEVEAKACGDTKMNGIQSLCSGNSLEGVKTMLLRNQPI